MDIWVIVGHEYCDTWLVGDAYRDFKTAKLIAEEYTNQSNAEGEDTVKYYAECVDLLNGYVEET